MLRSIVAAAFSATSIVPAFAATEVAAKTEAVESCSDASAYVPDTPQSWAAESRTAWSITGDILISKNNIGFENNASATLRYVGNIQKKAAHEAGAFSNIQCVALYAVDPPFSEYLLAGNSICGFHKSAGQPPVYLRYIALGIEKDGGLGLAAYTDGSSPILSSSLSGELCGTFGYFRKQ